VNLLTGAGLIAVCGLSLVCWSFAWRQRMRVDGVLADQSAAVSERDVRRGRRALGRDVRRAGKLAERSARDARRAARRSARAGSGAMLSSGAAYDNVAVSHGPSANGATGANIKAVGMNRSGGTGMNGNDENGSAGAGLNGPTGDNATELISQLRDMLVPLLSATGSQPALAEQASASGLPRRTPSASAFRPRTTVPMPRVESAPAPVRPAPVRQRAVPRLGAPAIDDGLGVPADSEEAWW
jgi:hypothetical protein